MTQYEYKSCDEEVLSHYMAITSEACSTPIVCIVKGVVVFMILLIMNNSFLTGPKFHHFLVKWHYAQDEIETRNQNTNNRSNQHESPLLISIPNAQQPSTQIQPMNASHPRHNHECNSIQYPKGPELFTLVQIQNFRVFIHPNGNGRSPLQIERHPMQLRQSPVFQHQRQPQRQSHAMMNHPNGHHFIR
mmetsp:Transcript_25868/g.54166  ORF Transcript_25868/g.54166 Transcript_25868/m.54166 type:complete len:189 (-) Transcript_25868:150-716(-)